MTITLYGIPNCDTVKKARAWLDAKGIAYTFHDYKKVGADPARVADWIAAAGRDRIVNRAGTTFRKLSEGDQAALGGDGAPEVLAANHLGDQTPCRGASGRLAGGVQGGGVDIHSGLN